MTKQDEIDRLAILMENWSLKMQLGQRDMQRLQAELAEENTVQKGTSAPEKEKQVKVVK